MCGGNTTACIAGWYSANFSAAQQFRAGVDHGYLQGCAFTTDKCLSDSGASLGSPAHFCSTTFDSYIGYCSLDRRYMSHCPAGEFAVLGF